MPDTKTLAIGGSIIGIIGLIVFFTLRNDVKKLATGAVNIVGDVASAVNPMDNNNVIYGAVNSAAGGGSSDFSIGSWIYEVTH